MIFLAVLNTNSITESRIGPVYDEIYHEIQSLLSRKSYGDGINEWRHVLFCNSYEFYKTKFLREIRRYTNHDTKVETCRWINDEQLQKANEKEIYRLICESILSSMNGLSREKNFDYTSFQADIRKLFRRKGWIYMQFFMTSEADAVFVDKIKFGQNSIEDKIKSKVSTKDYGIGISFWGHIIICCSPEFYAANFFKEIKKYSRTDKEIDLRLRIDYEAMIKADNKEASKLICDSVLRGVDISKSELNINEFNFEEFRSDLTTLFKKEGWI